MSRSFSRPFGARKGAYADLLGFKEGPENRDGIDYGRNMRNWKAFIYRQHWWLRNPGTASFRSGPEFTRPYLRNKYARRFQIQDHKLYRPSHHIDPENPYRVLEVWPESYEEDTPHTQFHQRYEYPYFAKNPWNLHYADEPMATSQYWRKREPLSWIEEGKEHPHDTTLAHFGLTYCILLRDIPDLGQRLDVVAIHPQQFRQELHPSKLAVVATRENCSLLGVPWDPLYIDVRKRELQGKLMYHQPWVWDRLQGSSWDEFLREDDAEEDSERDRLWEGDESRIEKPVFKADLIAQRKLESDRKKEEQRIEKEREAARAKGAAAEFFTL